MCLFSPVENLSRALPELHQKIAQVQALSQRAPSTGIMTESILTIKDLIEETRNFVNRVKIFFFKKKYNFRTKY